ncbi:hypothetical protein ACH5RR_009546 [Cinchona calisaya]|uniref:Uncharacterized protein n=1 Tax=Cinchona calisaya TaxID=153742 RepID=A0ABD3AGD8_9GENT
MNSEAGSSSSSDKKKPGESSHDEYFSTSDSSTAHEKSASSSHIGISPMEVSPSSSAEQEATKNLEAMSLQSDVKLAPENSQSLQNSEQQGLNGYENQPISDPDAQENAPQELHGKHNQNHPPQNLRNVSENQPDSDPAAQEDGPQELHGKHNPSDPFPQASEMRMSERRDRYRTRMRDRYRPRLRNKNDRNKNIPITSTTAAASSRRRVQICDIPTENLDKVADSGKMEKKRQDEDDEYDYDGDIDNEDDYDYGDDVDSEIDDQNISSTAKITTPQMKKQSVES